MVNAYQVRITASAVSFLTSAFLIISSLYDIFGMFAFLIAFFIMFALLTAYVNMSSKTLVFLVIVAALARGLRALRDAISDEKDDTPNDMEKVFREVNDRMEILLPLFAVAAIAAGVAIGADAKIKKAKNAES